jgi:hypothetical protein
VDRHEHIGKGKIGLEAFGRILNHPLLAARAFILETPIDAPGDDRRNVAALWKLLGRVVTANGEGMKPRPHRAKKVQGAKAAASRRAKTNFKTKKKAKTKSRSRGK